jgi:hypothetical protein
MEFIALFFIEFICSVTFIVNLCYLIFVFNPTFFTILIIFIDLNNLFDLYFYIMHPLYSNFILIIIILIINIFSFNFFNNTYFQFFFNINNYLKIYNKTKKNLNYLLMFDYKFILL